MRLSREHALELWRYYQAGVVNTVFGVFAYSLLVWLGANMYAAQLVAQVLGVIFNYLTYSRHVFRHATPTKLRFTISYAANYLVGVAVLTIIARYVSSPYIAGLGTAAIASVINYFALKYFVFLGKAA